jgi:hypothetical protein
MRKVAAVIALAVAVLLTGCTGSGIAELDREQRAADKLDLSSRYLEAGYDGASTRWLAEHDGVDFYAAESNEGTCVIMVKDGDVDGSFGGCGSEELKLSGGDFPTVRLYIDGPPPTVTKGMVELTPNLYVMEPVSE